MTRGRGVSQQRDDDDGVTGWLKLAFNHDKKRAIGIGDIETGQSVQVSRPGETMMSAAGWPFRSSHSD